MSPLVPLLVVAALTEAPELPVRADPRPEIPWIVAILAVPVDAGLDAAAVAKAGTAEVRALLDVGGSVRVDAAAGGALVDVEGPPDAEALVIAAARSLLPRGATAALFVEGATTSSARGALPPRRPPPTRAPLPPHAHRLAPSASLLDVEGAALALLVEDALAPLGRFDATVTLDPPALVVTGPDVPPADARAALDAVVGAPLAARVVDGLRARAVGAVAERHARVGAWAGDQARAWLAGAADDDDDDDRDLGVRLRARVFPSLLFPDATRAPAAASSRAR